MTTEQPTQAEILPEDVFEENISARYKVDELHFKYEKKRRSMDRLETGHLNLTLVPLIASLAIAGALKSEHIKGYYQELSVTGGIVASFSSCLGVAMMHSRKLKKARNTAVEGAKIVEEKRINPTPNWITEGVALKDWNEKEIPRAS
jgi:hypothetical protein